MTTYVNFTPSPAAPFQFQATLDGEQYTIIVTWNLFGQRFYANCYTLSGALVFSLPLVGSSVGRTIQTATWANNLATITTSIPHGFTVGTIANLTIGGMSPDGYNGTYQCSVINSTQVVYSLPNDPGVISSPGYMYYNINLAAGYFSTSSLVFRTANLQFEITP
jgi:hypothetical protein